MAKKCKVLIFDLETAPNLAYVWGMFKQNIGLNQVQAEGYVMSFAAKWLGEDKVMYFENRHGDDKPLIKRLIDLFDKADIVVAHNGNRFDVPIVMGRALVHGFAPPEPFKQIDTLQVARRQFRLMSNKLEHIANVLGCAPKLDHAKFAGFALWHQCLKQNDEAWEEMRKYNVQDVLTLEEVYLKLRPFMKNHPNVAIYEEPDEPACPKCGSKHIHYRGYFYTNAGKYRKFRCMTCKGWSSTRYTELNKDVAKNIMKNVG